MRIGRTKLPGLGIAILCVGAISGIGFGPSPVGAQTNSSNSSSASNPFSNNGGVGNPRAPRKTTDFTLRLSKRECRHLIVNHTPAADVAYKPGVDVRGKPVVSADVPNGYEHITPTVIEFDLAFNPLGNTGLDPNDFANTSAKVGSVKYDVLTWSASANNGSRS